MRLVCATGAITLVCLSGCYLSRVADEPDGGSPGDAGHLRDLGAPVVDAGARDSGAIVPTSCAEFWLALPWCPASPANAIDQPCDVEGTRCGLNCCEPAPAVVCTGGRWRSLDFVPDCSLVDCAGPTPCGVPVAGEMAGACAIGRVCVQLEAWGRGGDTAVRDRCVEPPTPIPSCSAAPPGSIVDEPRSCDLCQCADRELGVQILLSCPCC